MLIFLPSVCWMSCAVEHLKGSAFYTLMQLSPFLRCFPYCRSPLQGNPRQPRSGGQLDAIDFVTIAIPSLRSLRSRHNLRHFSYCATSLCAPAPQQHGAVARTTHTRAPARQKQANLCVSKKDESAVFGVWEKEHKDQKANDCNLL